MHELALCQSISRIGLRACGGRPVVRITIDVGALRQVVPATLVSCWSFVSADSLLTGSQLVVNDIPAVIECQECGQRTRLNQPFMVCGECGSRQVSVISGREFSVRSIDVETQIRSDDGQIPPA